MTIDDATIDLRACAVRVPPHVVYRPFVTETVVLNLDTGLYHGLSPVGGRMLEALERSPTVEDAVVAIAAEYDRSVDDVRPDVTEFCHDLAERGLVTIHGLATG